MARQYAPSACSRGVRTFTLTPQGEMREESRGPLLPLIWRSMPDLGPSFEQFAARLKSQAESGS